MLKSLHVGLLIAGTLSAQGAYTLHVSPQGDDQGLGTADRPFATLVRARDEIRALKERGPLPLGGVTVQIAGGVYPFVESFILEKQDSGTADAPIVYRCNPAERAWLDGGRDIPLADFRPLTDPGLLERIPDVARAQVRCINLSAQGIDYLRALPDVFNCYYRDLKNTVQLQLFHDGRPLYEARWPNRGFTHFNEVLDVGDNARVSGRDAKGGAFTFTSAPERLQRWAGAEELILHGYFRRDYYSYSARVAAIDPVTSAIRLSRGSVDEAHHSRRFYAHHLPEELDLPGEWYLHRKSGLLCLWPPEGADKQVTITVLNAPVITMAGASFVTLHGLGIQGGRQDAITMSAGESNRVTACEIRAIGWSGIVVAGGRDVRIAGCDIHDTGFGGISLSGGDRTTLTPSGHVAENNHIHHISHVVRNYTEPLLLEGVGNRASHNLIHHIPHIAVRFYGNEHIMEYNEIYHVAYETSECGVFYTGYDWSARGNIIRYNCLHHIDGVGGSPRFAHLDDSAAGTEIHGNVSYRIAAGPAICGGNENLVHDNLFIECGSGGSIGPRGQDDMIRDDKGDVVTATRSCMGYGLLKRLRRVPWQTPPWSTKYPRLAEIFTKDPIAAPWFNVVTRNVMVDCGRAIDVSGAMEKGWSTIENNWRGSAPGFVESDHTKMDFRLRPDAEVYKIGFQPIPFEKIGLYASPERASWPVQAEPAAPDWKPNWMLRREAQSSAAVTVFAVNSIRQGRTVVIDGNVTPEEWSPPDYDPVDPDRHQEIMVRWGLDKEEVPYPSKAYIETDDLNLYVAFVNPVDPQHGVSGGQRWGRDDAVEVSLAPVPDVEHQGGEVPFVFRGYANGYAECATEPGWLQAEVDRVMSTGVRYAAKSNGAGEWSAEWRIPFAALGLDPQVKSCPLLAHLSVRKPAGNHWVQWRRRTASTWKVHGAYALWLTAFGELPFVPGMLPAAARIDVVNLQDNIALTPGENIIIAPWSKPLGYRLTTQLGNVSAARWQACQFDFTPASDGTIMLELMGTLGEPTTWTYYDAFQVDGAELVNGDFEADAPNGIPAGWQRRLGAAELLQDAKLAATGSRLVKVSHEHRFSQELKVRKGQKVTVQFQARAALP